MARPRKDAEAVRLHVVSFRLTADEFTQLESEGRGVGIGANDCARVKTIGLPAPSSAAAPQVTAPGAVSFDLYQEVRRAGVNLNQIARKLHTLGYAEPAELAEAGQLLKEALTILLAELADRP